MKKAVHWIMVILGAAMIASSINLLLIPSQLLSGGVSGISLIVSYFTGWNMGVLYFLINLPLLIWGLVVIGRRFIILSVVSVILTTWFLQLIPIYKFSNDITIASVFGGVLIGLGSGITLRAGGSTGGFDIVGSIVTRKRDFPLGNFLFGINGIVILALGFFKQEWDLALNSMLSMYITGRLVDSIHIRHIKVTAFIITERKDSLVERLLRSPRGVTIIKTEGAFSLQQKDMLMTVTTRYELVALKEIIRECDPKAFVNIVETVEILGEFRRLK